MKAYIIKYLKKSCGLIKYIFEYGMMFFLLAISVLPLIWVFISSFKNNMEVLDSPFTWPSKFTLQSYADAIRISKLPVYYVNSLFISTASTFLALFIFAMAAYAVARFNFKGRYLIYIFLSTSLLIPINSMIQPIYFIIKKLQLYDTKIGLIFVYTAFGLPMSFFILRSYFLNIPREIEESAHIDGYGFFGIFTKIILPIAKPALCSAGVMLFLNSWNEFLFALLLTSSEKNRTLPLSLKYFVVNFSYDYPSLFAAIVMIVLPSIIIYVFLQEQIMESIVSGAVKG